jgi:hypothetical protein
LNNQKPSRIVPAMKRTSLVIALALLSAFPAFAQSTEFGVLIGGSRRFVDSAPSAPGDEFDEGNFSFANNTVDLYWALRLEEETFLKFKAGRIETSVPVAYEIPGINETFRRDVDGEVQHVEMNVEYRFSEPYGSTGMFAGLGLYRQTAEDEESSTNWGFNAGINADFPLSRRYGVVIEGTYHWNRADFQPRYLTLAGGLRVSF